MKNLLNEIKAMNKIAGTQLTKEQEIALIRERLEQLNELEFGTQKAFDSYQKQHDLRGDTEVTVAGKKMSVKQAVKQSKDSELKGSPVFGNDKGGEVFGKKSTGTASNDSFAKKMEKLNPGWNKKAVMKAIENEYEKDNPFDKEDHDEYMKDAEEWFDKMEKTKPTVKVGDTLKVKAMSLGGKEVYGRIKKETSMKGNFMFMGNVKPNKIPAWEIETYKDKEMTKPMGTLYYPQYEEGGSFKKA